MTTPLQKGISMSLLYKSIFQNHCASESHRASSEAIQFLIISKEICLFEGENLEFDMHLIERGLLSSRFEKQALDGNLMDR
jgi:hypothetical protein